MFIKPSFSGVAIPISTPTTDKKAKKIEAIQCGLASIYA